MNATTKDEFGAVQQADAWPNVNALACLCVGIAPARLKPIESFNDDDVYIYRVDTKEIRQVIPASSPLTIGIGGQGLRVRAGETWGKGLSCKRLGLWRVA